MQNNIMKKALSFIFALSVIFGLMPLTNVSAAEVPMTSAVSLIQDDTYLSVDTESTDRSIVSGRDTFEGKDIKDVILGGGLFGLTVATDGILVAGLADVVSGGESVVPALEAGFKRGDIIIKISGQKAHSCEDVRKAFNASKGSPVEFTVLRRDKEVNLSLAPVKQDSDGSFKGGLVIRDKMCGIGTVTYILPDGSFGGLGHGICDGETGVLLPMKKGVVENVGLSNVIKGLENKPGELHGNFFAKRNGVLLENTERGVFGIMDSVGEKGKTVPIASRNDVKEGMAKIVCTVCRDESGNNHKDEYDIEIVKINDEKSSTKNFIIKVTDPRLLEITGGIVQGMSGSPVIQDGKLVGAVTHVLVNDPTRGYGIFIENMLSSPHTSASDKAA